MEYKPHQSKFYLKVNWKQGFYLKQWSWKPQVQLIICYLRSICINHQKQHLSSEKEKLKGQRKKKLEKQEKASHT